MRRMLLPSKVSNCVLSNSPMRRKGLYSCPNAGLWNAPLPGWDGPLRLARDYERLTEAPAGWHWVAMVALLLKYTPLVSSRSS